MDRNISPSVPDQDNFSSSELSSNGHSTPNESVDRDQEATSVQPSTIENSSALEQAADAAEDTLIEVFPDDDSLLSEARESYPILRFCAANALLEQTFLDSLVRHFYATYPLRNTL